MFYDKGKPKGIYSFQILRPTQTCHELKAKIQLSKKNGFVNISSYLLKAALTYMQRMQTFSPSLFFVILSFLSLPLVHA